MACFFGAIADDFTGATDLAALLARSGVPVSVRIGVPDDSDTSSTIEIIALKIRTAPVQEAIADARSALGWLKRAGAQRFYWKYCSTFDSTKQGNIGPVAQALMADLDAPQAIYCPAFPENGRTVFMGNLFVGDVPLHESPMKDHPLTPMRDSNLLRVLAPQVGAAVGLVNRHVVARGADAVRVHLSQLAAQGIVHVIVDAVCADDLSVIAQASADMALITGGSAAAMPLPAIWRAQGLLSLDAGQPSHQPVSGPALVLSGSCSAMTNAQVGDYVAKGQPAYRLDPVELSTQGAEAALAWLALQPMDAAPIIYATANPSDVAAAQALLGRDRAGHLVEETLAQCAVAALSKGIRRFVVAGGETSGAVANALGIARLDVGPEIAPGVPWCGAISAQIPIAISLKSGNFGTPAFFSQALEMPQ